MDEYIVVVNGIEHTVLMPVEDAEARGLEKAKAVESKSRKPQNKASDDADAS